MRDLRAKIGGVGGRIGTRAAVLAGVLLVGCNDADIGATMTATIDGTPRDFGHAIEARNLEPGMLVQGSADDGSGYHLLVTAPTNLEAPGTVACDAASTDRNVVLTDPSGAKHIAIDGGSCSFTVTNVEGDGDRIVAFTFTATLPNGATTIAVSGEAEITGAR